MLFLTSDVGAVKKAQNGKKVITPLNNKYGFVDNLAKYLGHNRGDFVYIASDPVDYRNNDYYAKATFKSFQLSNFKFNSLVVLDEREQKFAEEIIRHASVVFLAGGDPRVEMEFFDSLNLAKLLKNSKSIIIGQSAGAINMADTVYCSPDGIEDLGKSKYYKGLGLTDISVEPHFVFKRGYGKSPEMGNHLIQDSKKKPFVAITDGSYIIVDNGQKTLYGEGYLFKDGKCVPLQNNCIINTEKETLQK